MLELIAYCALMVLLFMTGAFLLSMLLKDQSIVDIAWGLGFILIVLTSFFFTDSITTRQYVVAALVTLWGLRLSLHILARKIHRPEDWRYARWRKQWGRAFIPRSYLQVFVLQGFLMLLVAASVLLVFSDHTPGLNMLDLLGLTLWIVGFSFESIGDYQLAQFKKDPANQGKLMTSGLWKYTHHPNYFGEVICWWGIWLIALSVTNGWLGIVSPLTITILILGVSGIPMLEAKYADDPEFAEYKRRTSAFFPLPPRV